MSSFRQPLTGLRFAAGSYVDGRWVEGASSALAFTASVQPASSEDLQSLPENRRKLSTFALFTSTRLLGVDVESGTNPDRVTLHDGIYEVVSVARWQNNVIPHYKALVQRRAPGIAIDDTAGSGTPVGSGAGYVPSAPENLSALPILAEEVEDITIALAWVLTSDNETSVVVERCTGGLCTNFAQVASLAAGTEVWVDEDVAVETVYRYRVRAVNATGTSPPSNVATATIGDLGEFRATEDDEYRVLEND